MDIQAIKSTIENGSAVLGIEMGSTRIKAVLIDEKHNPIASGSHGWENRFENGVWTYHMDDVWTGLQDAYKNLKDDVLEKYGVKHELVLFPEGYHGLSLATGETCKELAENESYPPSAWLDLADNWVKNL